MFEFAPMGGAALINNEGGKGFAHWLDKDNGVFSCILCARDEAGEVFHMKSANDSCEALDCSQECEPNCKCGKKQAGASTNSKAKCTVFGIKIPQHKGFSRSKVEKKNPSAVLTLKRWARRLEHTSTMLAPSNWMRGVERVASVVKLSSIGARAKALFHGALASNFDYCAPARAGNDFKWSMHQLNAEGRCGGSEIAQHFCFPALGFAIALRPGDALMFNPGAHHCLSDESLQCAGDRARATTMHLKLGRAGENDVDATPAEEEKECLDIEHQFPFKT